MRTGGRERPSTNQLLKSCNSEFFVKQNVHSLQCNSNWCVSVQIDKLLMMTRENKSWKVRMGRQKVLFLLLSLMLISI
ncbi:hypothetical protein MANES_06G091550v8 [Manihot esculenta]|uniref:Uncharacterized protein n=1 Tax=Manihot esculenta TaxID=3983 RepID=A0ACB7HIR9_MANES|nr:hypothetical protein MANES_06G091550v8 [Manihot esculenta]